MRKIYLLFACFFLSGIHAQTTLRVLDDWGTLLFDINNNGNGVHRNGYYNYATNTTSSAESGVRSTRQISNDENVCGSMPYTATDNSTLEQPAYRKNGVWNAIGFFPGEVPVSGNSGNSLAISSNSKYVTGQMSSTNASKYYAYLYNTETNTLTKLTDGENIWGYARGESVNNAGYVSGFVDRPDIFNGGAFWVPAYFEPNGTLHYIDFATPEYGEAAGINNAGQIVGYKGNKAFIYDINTNTYRSFGSTSKISNPVFSNISDNGLVIGYEGDLGNRNAIVYHAGLDEPMLLTDYLTFKGIDITTFDGKLGTGMNISSDGKYLCGFDNSPAMFASGWIVHLDDFPQTPGCLTYPNGANPLSIYYPSCNGTTETISASAHTGEYSFVQLTAGKQYTFSSSVNTDFITIANENGTKVIKYGTGSVKIIATESLTVRFSLNLDNSCSYSSETRSKFINCSDPTGCQWTVNVFDTSYGDEVSWTLKDVSGETVLSGGNYGQGYNDTKTVFADGPLTFYIESLGMFGDNTPKYTISNGSTQVVSGALSPTTSREETYENLNCEILAVTGSDLSKFSYHPNPIKDILNISAEKNIISVSIYSLDGKLIMNNISINKKSEKINLSALKTGNYLAVASLSDGTSKAFKIIKE